jgi:hypothetical protein
MSAASQEKATAAADAAQLLIRLGLVILLVGLPLAGVVSHDAIYPLLPVGSGCVLCGVALSAPTSGWHHLQQALLTPLGVAAAFLALWAALSLLWTPFPGQAGEKLFKMAAPAVIAAMVAAFLPEKTRPFDLYLLPFGILATAAAALALVFLQPSWVFEDFGHDESLLERTVIALMVLVWPALGALALREHWIAAALLAIVVAFVALVDVARIALAAMGAGALVFALAMSTPRRVASILAIGSAATILLAPLLPLALAAGIGAASEIPAPISVAKEIVVTQWPRLVTGHGLDLANVGRSFGFLPAATPRSLLFLLWYDLGLVGAVAAAVVAALAFTAAGKVASLLGPALLSCFVAVLVIAGFGIAVSQIWWVTLLGCVAIAFALVKKAVARTQRPDAIVAGIGDASLEPS